MNSFRTVAIVAILFCIAGCTSERTNNAPPKNPPANYSDNKDKNPQSSIGSSQSTSSPSQSVVPIPKIEIDRIVYDIDKDRDGIKDADDLIQGGRQQIELKPEYVVDYYQGGYPPDNIAVCTDIVCRAFKNAGYDLKTMIDRDIAKNMKDYPRVEGKPDPNIDFRRVRNMVPFFKKYALSLTTEIKPHDKKNLVQWQGGDLVVFYWTGNEHIAIVSDQRNEEGVPYLIHTYGSYPKEDDRLLDWADTIKYHFRFPKPE
ncbi:MAG: DUF1287 domain-containing protein [Clostridia bacterium]|nr:DUF1287 domain-containing protein [Clostridia bacterium]